MGEGALKIAANVIVFRLVLRRRRRDPHAEWRAARLGEPFVGVGG